MCIHLTVRQQLPEADLQEGSREPWEKKVQKEKKLAGHSFNTQFCSPKVTKPLTLLKAFFPHQAR